MPLDITVFPSQLANQLAPINEERTLMFHTVSGAIIRRFPLPETETPTPGIREYEAYINSGLRFEGASPIPVASTIPGSVASLRSMYQYPLPETVVTMQKLFAQLLPNMRVYADAEKNPYDLLFELEKKVVVRNAGLLAIQIIGCIREVGMKGQFEYGSFEGVRQELVRSLEHEFASLTE